MKHGARHDPTHPALTHAADYSTVRVGGVSATAPDWFTAWNWQPTGNPLANDELSDCCEAADLVLVEGFRASHGLAPIPPDQLTELVKLRYVQVAGWDGTPATDVGTIPAEDCFAWQTVPILVEGGIWRVGPYTGFHRVVAGAERKGNLICRTYGFDVPVSHARVVAADLLLQVDLPAELRTAGVDWSVVSG